MWTCNYVEHANGLKLGLYIREYPSWIVDNDWQDDDWDYDDWRWNCREWKTEETFDGKWKTGRAMAAIAQPLGFLILVFHFVLFCTAFDKCVLKLIAGGMALVSTMKFLELIALSSDACQTLFGEGDCGFSTGAGMSIGSGVLWMIGFCIMSKVQEIPDVEGNEFSPGVAVAAAVPGSEQPPAGTTTTTETVMPDGSVKITKTTVNPDGSQTVVETVHHHAETEPEIAVSAMENAKTY
mmetsp:Transcript_7418/g.8868  ORF Transcript_7418/g.8868 Transcript_7418/m.8868 type:complete len:238 (+) Transcript_7418:91-804(+)